MAGAAAGPGHLARLVVRTDSFDPVVIEAPPALGDEAVQRLASLDRAVTSDAVERVLPLDAGSPPTRWAVGRRRGDDTVWRIVSAASLDALGGMAAWLWTAQDFEAGTPMGGGPTPEPLRQVLTRIGALATPAVPLADALAKLVGHLHAGEPAAVVVPHEHLAADPMAARWLAIAALLVLPAARRDELRVSVGEHAPSARAYDFVVTSATPAGFALVDLARLAEPPSGLVPFFVANRLRADDPEGLEAAARLFAGGVDRWVDGVAAMVRDGLPGLSDLPPELVEADPRGAAAVLAARLAAGSPLTPEIVSTLVEVTQRTWERAPWRELGHYAPHERAHAIHALVDAGHAPPTDWLLEVGPLVADGGAADAWARGLVAWLDLREDVESIAVAMEQLLMRHERTTLRVWQCGQLLDHLIEVGHVEAAGRLWAGPLLRAVVEEGRASELFADNPGEGPSADRARRLLTPLVLPDPDDRVERDRAQLVAALLRGVRDAPAVASAIAASWALRPGGPLPDDPVWAERPDLRPARAAPRAQPEPERPEPPMRPPPGIAPPALPEAGDELRRLLEAVAATPGGSPERGLVLAREAVVQTEFPDPALATAAEGVAARRGALPIWGFLTVAASPPDTWDDETIDATVVAYCGGRQDPESAAIARESLVRLGRAAPWEPLDIARWVVRIALAPRADGNRTLVIGLLQGVRGRPDAVRFLAEVLRSMFDLPPDHDASRMLVEALPVAGWSGAPLEAVIEALDPMNIPLSFRRTLVSIAEV